MILKVLIVLGFILWVWVVSFAVKALIRFNKELEDEKEFKKVRRWDI